MLTLFILRGDDDLFLKLARSIHSKWKESLTSVLPISVIVFIIAFLLIPVPSSSLLAFVFGAVLLVFGMGLFTLGTDVAMTPIGEAVGTALTRSRKLLFIIPVSFIIGVIVTMSEPDLQVLAGQVSGVPNLVLILAVAVGVGFFLVVALLRIIFNVPIKWLLFASYALVFGLTVFIPNSFISVAFDSGGVTTGPMTVPFILAMGVGVSSIRNDKNADNDSFGLVALCSVGPILAVSILSLFYNPESAGSVSYTLSSADTSIDMMSLFVSAAPEYLKDVGIALLPIFIFFVIFQFTSLHMHKRAVLKILIGLIYTYIGLVLFMIGVNVGFLPVGYYIGYLLGMVEYNWILIPIGMIIGYFVVSAEPAVYVLSKQVYELTAGAIPEKALKTALSIGVSCSLGLAMARILYDLPIMYFLIPGYGLSFILMFFVPNIFTSIAFDSGGVASGPMTATFLLPLAMGACSAGTHTSSDAFGIVAMVAMTPLIAIQILGLYFKIKQRKADKNVQLPSDDEIIDV